MQTDSQLPGAPPGSAPPGGYASLAEMPTHVLSSNIAFARRMISHCSNRPDATEAAKNFRLCLNDWQAELTRRGTKWLATNTKNL